MQNINEDYGLVKENEDGTFETGIKVVAIFYTDDGIPHRWGDASIVAFDSATNTSTFEFKLSTDDTMTVDSKIKIKLKFYFS